MTVAAHPASQRSSLSPSSRAPEQEALTSSRGPQTLSSRRAHARPAHPRRPKRLVVVAPADTTARRPAPPTHSAIRPRPSNPHRSAPNQTAPFLPAVSSLGGFRTPAPRPVPPSQRAGVRNPSV